MLCIMCITRAKTDMTGGEDTVYGASKLQLQLQECNLWLMYQSFGSLKFSQGSPFCQECMREYGVHFVQALVLDQQFGLQFGVHCKPESLKMALGTL